MLDFVYLALLPLLAGVFFWIVFQVRQEFATIARQLEEKHERQEAQLAALALQHSQTQQRIAKLEQKCRKLNEGLNQEIKKISNHLERLYKKHDDFASKITQLQEIVSLPADIETPKQRASPLFKEVMLLLDQGATSLDISKQKGLPVGEIDLIRSLKNYMSKDETNS